MNRPVLKYFIAAALLIILFGLVSWLVGSSLIKKGFDLAFVDPGFSTVTGERCDIAVISLSGELFSSEIDAGGYGSSAEKVVQDISKAEKDRHIKGIMLRVDSPGGSPVAGERIAQALRRSPKPTAAVAWDMADSAAYLASAGAGTIVAASTSEVGDIGVTSSYLDQSKLDQQQGLVFNQISAGQYKDVGNPDKPLTTGEKALLQKEVDDTYDIFVQDVSMYRNISLDETKKLANGSPYIAKDALDKKLIDLIGDDTTAIAWFKDKLGLHTDPVLCAPTY